ncbi:hypothetical protein ZHAS_00015910 [Anopheles sinensis]|uniref:Uncharacterized protein n=1 Tax=Anopheles sinensis TaxID=74873 RepID=A0A084WCK4_ANOSI|nr:hypothetical protein ZHAS_00015910 [Anopheles sinensis]
MTSKKQVNSDSPLKYRLSLYTSDQDALLVKTWYRFEEQAANVEERVCFMQHIIKKDIPSFMKGKRLDRVISVKGESGAFTLPNSFNSIILKDSLFQDGGVARNKGNIKTLRNKDKLLSVGTVSVHRQDEELMQMVELLEVNQNIKDKIAANALMNAEAEANASSSVNYSIDSESVDLETIVPVVEALRTARHMDDIGSMMKRFVDRTSRMWSSIPLASVVVGEIDRVQPNEFLDACGGNGCPEPTSLNYIHVEKVNVFAISQQGEVYLSYVQRGLVAAYNNSDSKCSVYMCLVREGESE